MTLWIRSLFARGLALLQIALLLSAGCSGGPLTPTPGSAEHQAPGMIPVPGGVVNAAGGNLLVARSDITLDSIIGGTQGVGAVYNSSLRSWTWSFAVAYDGSTLTDASGRSFDVSELPAGAAIPGSHWVKVDADTVQTKGGLAQHFDAQGRLAVVRWATLDYPRVRYTWAASTLELAQCSAAAVCAGLFRIEFDGAGRALSASDLRSARRAEFSWDAAGHLSVARSPLDVAKGWPGTRYEYTPLGLLRAITNSEGERIEYSYQSGGRISRVTQIGEGDPTHRFEFHSIDGDGLYETLYTNPLGARTRLGFDAQTRLVDRERLETGEQHTLSWVGLRPASVTLPNGATFAYGYAGDELVTIEEAGDNVIQITHQAGALNFENPNARAVRRIQDTLGLIEERTFDSAGRVASVANGEGENVAFAYNPASLVESLVQPNGSTFSFPLYGAHGHWLEITGAVADKRAFEATGDPRVETAKGRRGGVLNQYFDANRNLLSVGVAASNASGVTGSGIISIERRSDGQPVAVRRPYGGDHEFGYDALGRLREQRERVDGAWQTTTFEHDLAGNITARSRPNGMREEWQVDDYGRTTRYRALRYGTLEGEAGYVYQDGQLASMYDSIRGSSEQYSYDGAGRLVLTLYGYGETRALHYDMRSRVAAEALAVPGQTLFDVGYEYDRANRLVRVSDRTTDDTLIGHVIEAGEVVETRYGNGLVRAYSYDAAGLLVASETRNAAGAIVEITQVQRTGETNPIRLQVRTHTLTTLASTEEEYWLDAGDKLSDPGKRVFGWSPGFGEPRHYAYDELSNQVGTPGGDGFVYNAERNRLLTANLAGGGSLSYVHDEAGFVVSRGGVPITWTAAGRIAAYGGATATWDLSGRPIELAFGASSRRFDLFGGHVESDASVGSLGALDLGEVSLEPQSGGRSYRHLDFRSNVSFVSNDAGQITNHYRYSAYGVDRVYGAGANANTFVGKPAAGPFLLLGARTYDPATGRFLSPDPLFTLANQYVYTSGDPVLFMDASGLWEVSTKQGQAVAKGVMWAFAATALILSPPTGTLLLFFSVAGISVSAGLVYSDLAIAFGPGAAPPPPSPPPPPPPPPPAPPGNPSGGPPSGPGAQTKVVVISVGDVPTSSCSPTQIASAGWTGRLIPGLLLVNLAIGATIVWRRRNVQSDGNGGQPS